MPKHTTELLVVVALGATPIAACTQNAPPSKETAPAAAPAGAAMPAMPGMKQTGQRVEHMAEGKLNSVDAAAGRVNITHGPVASANWPGMTMSFKLADPSLAAALKPGQKVEFHFTIESGMDATVTQIKPIE